MSRSSIVTRLLATGAMALALSACGGNETGSTASADPVTVTPTPIPTPTPTPAPTTTPDETETVSATLLAALNASLDDERKAVATYTAVIDKLGPVTPFVNIIEAERQHTLMVEDLYYARDLELPEDSWEGNGSAADTLQENCEIGVAGEIENIAMYDRLLETITDEDVIEVFLALQAASRDNHLPAFENCAG